MACPTAPFVPPYAYVQFGVKYVRVFSYVYAYFEARKLSACQTHLSDLVLSITTAFAFLGALCSMYVFNL